MKRILSFTFVASAMLFAACGHKSEEDVETFKVTVSKGVVSPDWVPDGSDVKMLGSAEEKIPLEIYEASEVDATNILDSIPQ